MFSVLTATYNRKHTLPGVYDSLVKQTFRDFEWIIVDDGSTDETGKLVETWKNEVDFPIHYTYQQNQGKHVAFNRGVQQAAGDLLLSFDSDDTCVPQTLERFKFHWESIPEADRARYANLSVLCMDEKGDVVAGEYPRDVIDADSFLEQFRLRAGERWGINRTDVLKRFPYPEFPGERFAAEGIVWNRIASSYKSRFVNEKLRVYSATPDGLSAATLRTRVHSPRSASVYYAELTCMPITFRLRVRALVNYGRFSLHAGVPCLEFLLKSAYPLAIAALLPAAYLVFRWDRFQLRRAAPPEGTKNRGVMVTDG